MMNECGGHMCEPPWPAESVGMTWTCPECRLPHESMLVSDMQQIGRIRIPKTALIEGSIGWFGSRCVHADASVILPAEMWDDLMKDD